MAEVNPSRTVFGQPRGGSFFELSDTSTTGLAKSGPGVLYAMVVTGGTSGAVTLFDNTETSGTTIAAFGAGALSQDGLSGTVKAETYSFGPNGVDFQTGLVVETSAVDTPRVTLSFK